MADININEYIRTKNGKIDKVTNNDYYMPNYIECKKGIIERSSIVKHSKNIIDLIEEGDFVNGMEVTQFDDDETGELYLGFPIYDDALMDCIEEVRPLSTIEIKSIVTHEQFKSVEYNL